MNRLDGPRYHGVRAMGCGEAVNIKIQSVYAPE
jgi:hypothetical protein